MKHLLSRSSPTIPGKVHWKISSTSAFRRNAWNSGVHQSLENDAAFRGKGDLLSFRLCLCVEMYCFITLSARCPLQQSRAHARLPQPEFSGAAAFQMSEFDSSGFRASSPVPSFLLRSPGCTFPTAPDSCREADRWK